MVEVTCVLGMCAPERLKTVLAVSLALRADAVYKLPHPGNADDLGPLLETALDGWLAGGARRVVVEAPELARPAELLAAFDRLRRAVPGRMRLRGLITSVDAGHLSAELEDCSWVVVDSPESLGSEPLEARAQIAVDQIEFADVLVVSGPQPAGSAVAPLLRALAPQAQLVALRRGLQLRLPEDRGVEHDASGWMQLLSRPPLLDAGHGRGDAVSSFAYSRVRPFHPGRLMALLEGSVERGIFGSVVRSAGFCRFSTRPERSAHWSQVGHVIAFDPLGADADMDAGTDAAAADSELVAVGQEIAFIGRGLNQSALTRALDSCVLTDDEFAAGPEAWRRHDDPLPKWILEDDQSER